MYALRFLASAVFAATAVSASAVEGDNVFAALLKRQEPGTPAYNCHDNCGQAIIEAREGDDICNSASFLANYKNCLQCAGPDNVGIWQYYGNSVGAAGKGCGLDSEPLTGKQPDVGPSTPIGSGGSSPTPPSTEAPEPEPTDDEPTSEPPASSEGEATETSAETPSATDDATETGATTAAPTPTESGSADDDDDETPTAGGDDESAAPTPSSPVQVDAAGSLRVGSAMGLFVAAAFGAVIFV
ncbi:uncharacterized protein DNG_09056 [Cephalotrichum gorgonifer]|uniref:Uncharacterized protein n=1 Tax=Cephalotrichum gorgonifer TaxID=2041049 RepID=A0AAE8N552_9PEZI|nr:uncharacterized protein DNG_09056 [Cephalotrichum gorgonifer]